MKGCDFERTYRSLRKKYKGMIGNEESRDFRRDLLEAFLLSLGENEEMGRELFDYCTRLDLMEKLQVEKLADMLDLFHQNYDSSCNQLNDEDWVFVKELVNGFAEEMDMDNLTYVMQQVVEAGVFG